MTEAIHTNRKRPKAAYESEKQIGKFVLGLLIVPVVSFLGLVFQSQLENVLLSFEVSWALPLLDPAAITATWLAILAVHSAIGAIAPILGYTLLTTAATPASRIAPPGFVVAKVIKWRAYLTTSLSLLAGSLLGVIVAPSLVGLVVAALCTCTVIVMTFIVFRDGFELLEREDRFDQAARGYLKEVVVDIQPQPAIAEQTKQNLATFNEWIEGLNEIESSGIQSYGVLHVGVGTQASEVLSVRAGAGRRIESIASKSGVQIWKLKGRNIPDYFGIGRRPVLAISLLSSAKPTAESEPAEPSETINDSSPQTIRMQDELSKLVAFGRGGWTSQQARIPMLVSRHLSTMLYEAVPRQMPHDLRYGLEVLGDIIDTLTEKDGDYVAFDMDSYRWTYETPAFLTDQLCRLQVYEPTPVVDMVSFLRGRLKLWLPDDKRMGIARPYLYLLSRLLVFAIKQRHDQAERVAMYIREIPFMARNSGSQMYVELGRMLVVTFINKEIRDVGFTAARKVALKTLREILSYATSTKSDFYRTSLEAKVSALAVTMYLAHEGLEYRNHIEQISAELLRRDEDRDSSALELLAISRDADGIVRAWRWDWWEMDQKESGRAHIMSMELWFQRACAILLAQISWQIQYLTDEEIPALGTIFQLNRSIAPDDGWLDILTPELAQPMPGLARALGEVQQRREAIVNARVAAADIDLDKCQSYLASTIENIRAVHGSHNSWLVLSNSIRYSESPQETTSGSVRLVPRDSFVSDENLDIGVHLMPPDDGSVLVDFEVNEIAKKLMSSGIYDSERRQLQDSEIWQFAQELIDRNIAPVFVIGYGVAEYEIWDFVSSLKSFAEARPSRGLRFMSTRLDQSRESERGIIIGLANLSFEVVRYPMGASDQDVVAIDSTPLSEGGVSVEISTISERERLQWLAATEGSERSGLEARYAESLVYRVRWSFDVNVLDVANYRVFKIG